ASLPRGVFRRGGHTTVQRLSFAAPHGPELCFILNVGRSQDSTLFPYTTLFRSRRGRSDSCSSPGNWRPRCPGFQVASAPGSSSRSEEHTSELQSLRHLVCRLLLEKNTSCPRRYGWRPCNLPPCPCRPPCRPRCS